MASPKVVVPEPDAPVISSLTSAIFLYRMVDSPLSTNLGEMQSLGIPSRLGPMTASGRSERQVQSHFRFHACQLSAGNRAAGDFLCMTVHGTEHSLYHSTEESRNRLWQNQFRERADVLEGLVLRLDRLIAISSTTSVIRFLKLPMSDAIATPGDVSIRTASNAQHL